jgi:predicted  nucleic acid-binding Zn-ribbon protein
MDTEQLAIKLQKTDDRSIRNEGRIKKLESESEVLHQLATSVAVMAEQMKTMNHSVTTLTGEVEELKDKPGKRWESLVNNIIWGVTGAVLAFLLAKFGL